MNAIIDNDGAKEGESTPSLECDSNESEQHESKTRWNKFVEIYNEYEFLILIVLVILLARAYPPLGAVYLAPHITATWIAVVFIFRTYPY